MAGRSTAKGILPILRTDEEGFEVAFRRLVERRVAGGDRVEKEARKIVDRVRKGGDRELLACVRRYDGAKLEALEVTRGPGADRKELLAGLPHGAEESDRGE